MRKFILIREENLNGWLYGNLYLESKFICSTLEVSGSELRDNANYRLYAKYDKENSRNVIKIINNVTVQVSEFVAINTYNYKNVEQRINDSSITVGNRVNLPNLVMRNYMFDKLFRIIREEQLSLSSDIPTFELYIDTKMQKMCSIT